MTISDSKPAKLNIAQSLINLRKILYYAKRYSRNLRKNLKKSVLLLDLQERLAGAAKAFKGHF